MEYKQKCLDLHLEFPRDYIALSRGWTSSHKGIDMGWNRAHGGQYAPVYSPGDGEVVAAVDGKKNTWPSSSGGWGNYIKIKHADGIYTLMAHLKTGTQLVKIGDKVTRHQQIANMNSSGYSSGCHVHFEVYIGGSGTSYRVDPLLYTFAYPTDTIGETTIKTYAIKTYTPVVYVGSPVARDSKKQQAVIKDLKVLRARAGAGLKADILGFVNPGYYDIIATTTADGYTWYQTGECFWFAGVNGVEYLPRTAPKFDVEAFNLSEEQNDTFTLFCRENGLKFSSREV